MKKNVLLFLPLFLIGCGTTGVPECTHPGGCAHYVVTKYDEAGEFVSDFSGDGFLFPVYKNQFRFPGDRFFQDIHFDSQNLLWLIKSYYTNQGVKLSYQLYNESGSIFEDLPPKPRGTYETPVPRANTSYSSYSSFSKHGGRELKRNSNTRGVLNQILFCLSAETPSPEEPFTCSIANARTGFDTSFGSGGWLSVNLHPTTRYPVHAVHWTENSIYVAAELSSEDDPGQSNLVLMKFNERGEIISTFGSAGKVIIPFESARFTQKVVREVDVDSNDRILVLYGSEAQTSEGISRLKVSRYSSDGVLDSSFATDGTIDLGRTELLGGPDRNGEMKIQSDDKILVSVDHVIKRFREDGTPDPRFGFFGGMIMPIQPDRSNSIIRAIKLDKHSRIYVLAGSEINKKVYRLSTAGGVDADYPTGSHINYTSLEGITDRAEIIDFAVDENSTVSINLYVLAIESFPPP